jgi:alpha-D-ribose 1-methylphosphonate 5-triphosphate synthase subunit PhnH
VKLSYLLSKSYTTAQFIENGVELKPEASVEIDPALLTPELRAHIARIHGPRIPTEFKLGYYRPGLGGSDVQRSDVLALDAPATDADALALFEQDMTRWEAAEMSRQELAAQREAERAESQRRNAEQAALREAEALADAQAKARREADKLAWVEVHGSEHLAQAVAAGYDCQRLYVSERAAAERPGFVVDFDDRADWRTRSCPSEAALALAEAHGGTVVWLTNSAYELHEAEFWEPREAVVIREYLGKYDLIREL